MKKTVLIYLTVLSVSCTQSKNASPVEQSPKTIPSSQSALAPEPKNSDMQLQDQNTPKNINEDVIPELLPSAQLAPSTPSPQLIRKLKFKDDPKKFQYSDFSANNKLLVTVSKKSEVIPGSITYNVNVYNLESDDEELSPIITFPHSIKLRNPVSTWMPIVTSNGNIVFQIEGSVIVTNILTGYGGRIFDGPQYSTPKAVSVSADNKRLAIGFVRAHPSESWDYNLIRVFDIASGQLIAEFSSEGGSRSSQGGLIENSIQFSPDGNYVFAGYDSSCYEAYRFYKVIEVYNILNKKSLNIKKNDCGPLSDFFTKSMFSEDSKTISIFSNRFSTMVVDLESEKILSKPELIEKRDDSFTNVTLSPNRRFKVVRVPLNGGLISGYRLYDLQSTSWNSLYFQDDFNAHGDKNKFFMSGNQIVLSEQDPKSAFFAKIYDMPTLKLTATIKNRVQLVSQDGRYAIIGNSLWQLY